MGILDTKTQAGAKEGNSKGGCRIMSWSLFVFNLVHDGVIFDFVTDVEALCEYICTPLLLATRLYQLFSCCTLYGLRVQHAYQVFSHAAICTKNSVSCLKNRLQYLPLYCSVRVQVPVQVLPSGQRRKKLQYLVLPGSNISLRIISTVDKATVPVHLSSCGICHTYIIMHV